jgi:hypothetical protein
LVAGGDDILLCDEQGSDLEQLVGLLTRELVGEAKLLHLAACALCACLQPLQLARVQFHRFLLLVKRQEESVVRFFLRFRSQVL